MLEPIQVVELSGIGILSIGYFIFGEHSMGNVVLSKKRFDRTYFLWFAAALVTLFPVAVGFGVNGTDSIAEYCFIASWASATMIAWFALVFLTRFLRLVSTLILSCIIALGMWCCYHAICPSIEDLPSIYQHALEINIFVQPDAHYDEGTLIAGLHWKPGSVLTTVRVGTVNDLRLSEVHSFLSFDAGMMGGVQQSNAPTVVLQPLKRTVPSGYAGEVGTLDKDGHYLTRHSTTPEEIENINSLPASTFVFNVEKMSPDLPITLVFVGGNGYQLGGFTFWGPSDQWFPRTLKMQGTYDVQYRRRTFTLPFTAEIHSSQSPPGTEKQDLHLPVRGMWHATMKENDKQSSFPLRGELHIEHDIEKEPQEQVGISDKVNVNVHRAPSIELKPPAYIQVDKVKLTGMGTPLRPIVEVYYGNYHGQAPADLEFADAKPFFVSDPPSLDTEGKLFSTFQKTIPHKLGTIIQLSIGDGSVLQLSVPAIKSETLNDDFLSGGKWLYVMGAMIWKDPIGEHRKGICRYFWPPNIKRPIPSEVNPFAPLDRWMACSPDAMKRWESE